MEASDSQEIQLDDDLAMTQTELNTKCPVTMKEMVKPVRNKHCGHSYDFDAAKQLIRNRQQARYCNHTCDIQLLFQPSSTSDWSNFISVPEIISKLFQRLIVTDKYFPTCSMSLK